MRSGNPEWDGMRFDINDQRIPPAIAEQVKNDYREGCMLVFMDTKDGGEWWLLDEENLIEAYWLE